MSNEKRKTILVVDDESHICLMMADLLMDTYDVLTAKDGVEALEMVAEKQDALDLVITDIRMPRMDGMELLKEIKTHYPEIGVMMISAHGNLRTAVEAMKQGAYDYIPKPLPEFDELDITISRYFEKRQLEQRIQQHERAEMERIYGELEDARQIQQSLLPKRIPQMTGFEIFGTYLPAKEVSGDFYDYLSMGQNICVILADVTGKSVKAAMVAALADGMLHSEIEYREDIWDSPGKILGRLNARLQPRLIRGMFTAMSLGIICSQERKLLLSNAGMPYPIVKRGKEAWELEVRGMPLGLIDRVEYQDLSFDLKEGDFVVFCSDGVIEAENESGGMYQTEKLLEVIQQANPHSSPQEMLDWIVRDIRAYVGDVEQSDDITIVVLRCGEGGNP